MRPKVVLVSLLALALFLIQGSNMLAGGPWYVNAATGNDNNDCLSKVTACKTISHAISLASGGDTIKVAAGTYTENLTINTSLTIAGADAATTIIDGGHVNTVITIPNASSNVQILRLTIQNGSTTTNGGGISNTGTLTVSHSTFSGNSAGSGGGGGIYNDDGVVTVNNSTLSDNSGDYGGGGIYSGNFFGALTVNNSTLSGNSAFFGGAIESSFGVVTVNNSTLSDNSGYYGGGIDTYGGSLTITNSTLTGNSARYHGGGISVNSGLTVSHSTFSGNSTSGGGGGIYLEGGQGTISNSTFSGNSAGSDGGGIKSFASYGFMTISNSTFSGNSAAFGGSIDRLDGRLEFQNTIIANSPSGGNCHGKMYSNGYNLSSDGTCPFTMPGDLNNTDPMLGPLKNNGGLTQTHALLVGSPALDAGNPAPPGSGGSACEADDQRGVPRPQPEGSRCDMGAYERK